MLGHGHAHLQLPPPRSPQRRGVWRALWIAQQHRLYTLKRVPDDGSGASVNALRHHLRRLPIGERGQAMVEFALVAPIFFLLLFAIIEGGRFIFYYETLNNATREGARYAIVHGSNAKCPAGPSGPMPPGIAAP